MSNTRNTDRAGMTRRAALAGAGGAALLGAASPRLQAATPRRGGTFRMAYSAAADTLDPQATLNITTQQYSSMVFDNLTALDDNNQALPSLAVKWTPEKHGQEWVFDLREGVHFHHGTEFTAEDVVATVERAYDPKLALNATGAFGPLKEARAEGRYRVRLVMTQPFGELPVAVANRWGRIVPKDRIDQLKTAPSGTGPFRLADFQPGASMTMARNPHYWMPDRPYLDAAKLVVIHDAMAQQAALRSNEVDFINAISAESYLTIRSARGINAYSSGTGVYQPVMLQANLPPFDNPKVREAVACAIPYQKIMDAVLFGLAKPMFGAAADKATEVAWPQPTKYVTDIARAKALLAEAGHPNGFETTLSFDLGFAGVNEPLCVLVQESLAQIGIKTTINKIPGANWRTELNKKVLPLYTNVFSGWLDYPEYFFIWCYDGKNSIFNTMSYQSKAMDEFISGAVDAAATGNTAKYDTDVKGFVDLAFKDIPRIPLYQPYVNVAMQKNVSGYQYWFHRRLDYRALVKA